MGGHIKLEKHCSKERNTHTQQKLSRSEVFALVINVCGVKVTALWLPNKYWRKKR